MACWGRRHGFPPILGHDRLEHVPAEWIAAAYCRRLEPELVCRRIQCAGVGRVDECMVAVKSPWAAALAVMPPVGIRAVSAMFRSLCFRAAFRDPGAALSAGVSVFPERPPPQMSCGGGAAGCCAGPLAFSFFLPASTAGPRLQNGARAPRLAAHGYRPCRVRTPVQRCRGRG